MQISDLKKKSFVETHFFQTALNFGQNYNYLADHQTDGIRSIQAFYIQDHIITSVKVC